MNPWITSGRGLRDTRLPAGAITRPASSGCLACAESETFASAPLHASPRLRRRRSLGTRRGSAGALGGGFSSRLAKQPSAARRWRRADLVPSTGEGVWIWQVLLAQGSAPLDRRPILLSAENADQVGASDRTAVGSPRLAVCWRWAAISPATRAGSTSQGPWPAGISWTVAVGIRSMDGRAPWGDR